tara:strand:+ start:3829 stop:4551 length:723 start_codon:yes stop_codon:yes gene_type:complete
MKFLIVLFFLFKYFSIFSQYPFVREKIENLPNFDKKILHYGYFVGLNDYDFKFEYSSNYYTLLNLNDIEIEKSNGFNVGLIGDLRINDFFNLRFEPGLYANQRKLIYPDQDGLNSENDKIREIKSTYIHLPLLIKFSSLRINNFKPYVVGGISSSLNLSSNEKNNDDNSNNVFRMKTNSLYYEVGFGIDFYLTYFKFSPSIRGIFSLKNELVRDNDLNSPWTSNIENLYSRGLLINFTFE